MRISIKGGLKRALSRKRGPFSIFYPKGVGGGANTKQGYLFQAGRLFKDLLYIVKNKKKREKIIYWFFVCFVLFVFCFIFSSFVMCIYFCYFGLQFVAVRIPGRHMAEKKKKREAIVIITID